MKSRILLIFFLVFFLNTLVLGQEVASLLAQLEKETNPTKKKELYRQVGNIYQQKGAYKKAIAYLQHAIDKEKLEEDIETQHQLLHLYTMVQDFTSSLNIGDQLIEYYKKTNNTSALIDLLEDNSRNAALSNQYDRAIQYNEPLAEIYNVQKNYEGEFRALNNLGVSYRRTKNNEKAMSFFQKALELNKEQLKSSYKLPENRQAILQMNTGVSYLQLEEYEKANYHFEEALRLALKSQDNKTIASAYNYQALAAYLNDQNNRAINHALEAKNFAEATGDVENQLAAYKTLSIVYKSEDNYKEAQEYSDKYQKLASSLEKQRQEQIQKNLQYEVEIEKEEGQVKSFLAEQERREAALREAELQKQKAEVEREKAQKELDIQRQQYAILQRDKELQAAKLREQLSEKQRIEQLLELTKQKAETEKHAQEVERQRLIAEKERAEKERTEKELTLSQEQQRLQEATIRQKNQIQYLLYAIATIILLALIFVFRSLRTTKKLNKQLSSKNKKIAEQNLALKEKQEEINVQNEELQQQAEEIMAQRDTLATMNSELDKKNRDIMASIHYASRIQKGILPMDDELKKWFTDCFVLFKPRDVVSGDFYWFASDKNMCIVAACDCTGHGVPGSLMSMIASSALSKSFHEKSLRKPDLLLQQANNEIIQSLDQITNKSADGMDAAVCAYYPQENKIIFAGAKNGVVYIKNNEMSYIKGDNHPVGDYNYGIDRIYTAHEITVENGLCAYVFSDGYGDQFGGKKGKKYGKKQLQETFQQIHLLPCYEQKEKLDKIHVDWMEEANEKQIDDVLVIGFKILPKS